MSQMQSSSLFLSLPEGIVMVSVHETDSCVVVQIACERTSAACPLCHQVSERVHGNYVRTVADLPCAGRRVLLKFTVRKFVCTSHPCQQKVFTERVPELVQSYARMTNRLCEVLQTLGFATCAEVSERLAPKLGMKVTGPTLLRHMRTLSCPPVETVSLLGVDDWAWRRGQTYGTLLVDLERHQPIELLPDRHVATVEAWLRTHPEVRIVSRDRGGEYAAAARLGAPQAQQIADKFHLLKNLREALKDLMARHQSRLPEAEEPASDAIPTKALGFQERTAPSSSLPSDEQEEKKHYRTIPPTPYARPPMVNYNEHRKQISRLNRYARYEAVRLLHQQGLSIHKIARYLELSRETVTKFVNAEVFPERTPTPKKGSLLDPHKPYILKRWQEGCRNSVQLHDEIKLAGYTGSAPLLRLFLADLRKKHRATGDLSSLALDSTGTTIEMPSPLPPKAKVARRMSARTASWLFVSQPDRLKGRQKLQIDDIKAAHPDLDLAYSLGQGFVLMLAERRGKDFDAWLCSAQQSKLPELQRFANGLQRDYEAVKAAFSSEISNGQVEGQVHRLKLQKRMVYGRANFDLLRLRVLHRT